MTEVASDLPQQEVVQAEISSYSNSSEVSVEPKSGDVVATPTEPITPEEKQNTAIIEQISTPEKVPTMTNNDTTNSATPEDSSTAVVAGASSPSPQDEGKKEKKETQQETEEHKLETTTSNNKPEVTEVTASTVNAEQEQEAADVIICEDTHVASPTPSKMELPQTDVTPVALTAAQATDNLLVTAITGENLFETNEQVASGIASTLLESLPKEGEPFDFTVVNVQKLLKHEENNVDELLKQDHQKLSQYKKQVVIAAKKNWLIERDVDDFGNKINRLIRARVRAEELRPMLQDSHGLRELKNQLPESLPHLKEEALEVYASVFYLLRSNPKYLSVLTKLVKGKNVDTFLQTVVFTLFGDQFDDREENLLLQLFENVLIKEFEQCPSIGEFMRANTAFTKMLSAVIRRSTYHHYLVKVLAEPIKMVLNDKDLDLEVNPVNILKEAKESGTAEPSKQEMQKMIEPRVQKICSLTSIFLQRIYASVEDMPYGIRYVSKKILQYGREKFTNATSAEIFSLVGGFVFLRFINPAITTCDSTATRLVQKPLTSKQRKNLTYICKILQNLSNGVTFGSIKEPYMTPFNEFLNEGTINMNKFFTEICQVEEIDKKLEMDELYEFSRETKVINISYNEVSLIHQLCEEHLSQLCLLPTDQFRALMSRLATLGPSPKQTTKKNDYFFNLKLSDPNREAVATKLAAESDTLGVQARMSISGILRIIPTLPSHASAPFISLMDVLKAAHRHASQKGDLLLANRVEQGIAYLQELAKSPAENSAGKDRFEILLKGIYYDIKSKAIEKEKLEKKIKLLEKVLKDINDRHEYLTAQLEMYKSYLANALANTFKTNSGISATSATAQAQTAPEPIKMKFRKLVKNGVVIESPVAKPVQKSVKVYISCLSPGNFDFKSTPVTGLDFNFKVDWNELLEMQAKNLKEMKVNGVRIDINMLIMQLSRLFLIGKQQKTRTSSLGVRRRVNSNATTTSNHS